MTKNLLRCKRIKPDKYAIRMQANGRGEAAQSAREIENPMRVDPMLDGWPPYRPYSITFTPKNRYRASRDEEYAVMSCLLDVIDGGLPRVSIIRDRISLRAKFARQVAACGSSGLWGKDRLSIARGREEPYKAKQDAGPERQFRWHSVPMISRP